VKKVKKGRKKRERDHKREEGRMTSDGKGR